MVFALIALAVVAGVVVVLQLKHNATLLSVESKLETVAQQVEAWVKTHV